MALGRGFHPSDFGRKRRPGRENPRESEPAEPAAPSATSEAGAATVRLAAWGLGQLARWGCGQAVESIRANQKLEMDLPRLARERMGILTVADVAGHCRVSPARAEAGLSRFVRRGQCRRAISRKGQEIFIFSEFLPRLWACDYCDNRFSHQAPSCPCCGARLREAPVDPEVAG